MSKSPKKARTKQSLRSSRARSVAIYLAALFLIAILLLLLAYFMQERSIQALSSFT